MPDIKESQNIASLHNQITACDSILEVGEYLRSSCYSDELCGSGIHCMVGTECLHNVIKPCYFDFVGEYSQNTKSTKSLVIFLTNLG